MDNATRVGCAHIKTRTRTLQPRTQAWDLSRRLGLPVLRSFLLAYASPQLLRDTQHTAVPRGELLSGAGRGVAEERRVVAMARALALMLAALTVAADAARPRPVRALAVRGGS